MIAAGCEAWERAENLSVMGLFEIIPHLPRLLRIRRELIERVLAERPAVYVGVDAQGIQPAARAALKARGIPHGAVREPAGLGLAAGPGAHDRPRGRSGAVPAAVREAVLRRARACARCSSAIRSPIRFRCISIRAPRARALGLAERGRVRRAAAGQPPWRSVAAEPGFRGDRRLAACSGARSCASSPRWPTTPRAQMFERRAARRAGVRDRVTLVDGHAQQVMAASDVVLLASGTATLEATLVKRPMVVAYRLGALTSFLLKHLKLFKAPFFAQPNLLAGRQVVPEYFNDEVRADVLGPAVLEQLERADRDQLVQTFTSIHETLRRDASARAADAIVELMLKRRAGCVAMESTRDDSRTAGASICAARRAASPASTRPAAARSPGRSSRRR